MIPRTHGYVNQSALDRVWTVEDVKEVNVKIAEGKCRVAARKEYDKGVLRWAQNENWKEQKGKVLPWRDGAPQGKDRDARPCSHPPDQCIARVPNDHLGSVSQIWHDMCAQGYVFTVAFTLVGFEVKKDDRAKRNHTCGQLHKMLSMTSGMCSGYLLENYLDNITEHGQCIQTDLFEVPDVLLRAVCDKLDGHLGKGRVGT